MDKTQYACSTFGLYKYKYFIYIFIINTNPQIYLLCNMRTFPFDNRVCKCCVCIPMKQYCGSRI